MSSTQRITEISDLKAEKAIDSLRLTAFATNDPDDLQAYYYAVSDYFQDRHSRRLEAAVEVAEVVQV